MNSRAYQIYVRGNGSESNVTSVQHIKLMPLNQEQIDKANKVGLNNQSLLSTTLMPSSYNSLGGVNGNFIYSFNNISSKWSTLFDTPSSVNGSLIKNALNNG